MSNASQTAAHDHTRSYVTIFVMLVVAFLLSLGLGMITGSPFVIGLIFLIAGFKAYLVLAHFVHLKREPRFIKLLVVGLLAVLVVLYVGLLPDVVYVWGGPEEMP